MSGLAEPTDHRDIHRDTQGRQIPVGGSESLDASGLLGWARRCVDRLKQHREEINSLNVFPVPDSDTGTNLLHTMRAALDEAEGEAAWTGEGGGRPGAREIALALGHGAVHGARGNSGVILSQVLRAVGEAATFTVLDATTFRRALRTAVTLVDHALSDPVEGTIVSVLRAAAAAASRSSAATLHEVARAAADAAAEALEATAGQLPVLRRAGVVDAGGRGLLVLLDTFVEVLTGQVPTRRAYRPEPTGEGAPGTDGAASAGGPDGSSGAVTEAGADADPGPRFEVMYALTHTDSRRVDHLRTVLRGLGDSVVVVGDGVPGDDGRWTVHVHTDAIGEVVEAGLIGGRLGELRVEDLRGDAPVPARRGRPARAEDGPRGVIAVCPPGAVAELFTEAGARVVTPGRDADLVAAVLAAEASEAVVLPNGELSREQVASIDAGASDDGRRYLVIPTGSVVQGLAALAVHDPVATLSVDAFAMADAAASTRHAHVDEATHEALTLVGRCTPGDLLGILGADVALIATDPVDAVADLADRLLSAGGELVTLLFGAGFDADARARCADLVRRRHPDVDVADFDGGADLGSVAVIGVE